MVAARLAFDPSARGVIPGDCAVCRDPEHVDDRVKWGCDQDAEIPFATPWKCPACTESTVTSCGLCGGTGAIRVSRCERQVVGERERFVCQAAALLETGIPPWGGAAGWSDWPATFVDALCVVLAERASIAEERRSGGD